MQKALTLLGLVMSLTVMAHEKLPDVGQPTMSGPPKLTNHQIQAAKSHGLSVKEYERFLEILETPRAFFTPNISKNPVFALLLEARTDSERDRYAEMVVKLETDNQNKINEAQRAVDRAKVRLFGPNAPLFEHQGAGTAQLAAMKSASSNGSSPLIPPRYQLYLRAEGCTECMGEFKKIYSTLKTNTYSGLDIYFVGATDEKIQQWAMSSGLTGEEVKIGKVTLNRASENEVTQDLPFGNIFFVN